MITFNIFNVLKHLSDLNKIEINFANNLSEIIDNYIIAINNDYEDGQLIDHEEGEDMEFDLQSNEDSDFEIENETKKVSFKYL